MSIELEKLNLNNNHRVTDNNIEGTKSDPRMIKLQEKAQEMESIFLTQMIKAMRKTVPGNSIGGSENKSSLSSMMFSSVMGKALAKSGGVGLADKIFSSLKKMDHEQIQKIQSEELDQSTLPISTFNFLKTNTTGLKNE